MSLLYTLTIQEHFQPPAQMNRKTTRANSSRIPPMILKQSCPVCPTITNQYDALNRLRPALNPNGIASFSPVVAESDEATLGSSPINATQPCKRLNALFSFLIGSAFGDISNQQKGMP